MTPARRVTLWAAPLLAFTLVALAKTADADTLVMGLEPDALVVLGITIWMAAWWITECVPVGATALIPLAAFPFFAVVPMGAIVTPYMNPFIVLLMTGFMAALAIERWGLHKRLALTVLFAIGTSPKRLVLAMMLVTAFSSMWISNTASTLIMLPIGMALLNQLEDAGAEPAVVRHLGVAVFLGVAYSASIGGLATPIGTPPNLIFLGVYEQTFGTAPSFAEWMAWGLPLVVIGLPLLFLYLTSVGPKLPKHLPGGSREDLRRQLRALGPMSSDERSVALVFGTMVVLWITGEIRVGDDTWGWAPLLGLSDHVHESTVAVLGVLALFVIPARTKPGERVLDWPTATRIPWDVVLLFGGGLALAHAFNASGLSQALSEQLTGLADLPEPLLILSICLSVTFLTEVTSNTATTSILMPILATFAVSSGLDPIKVMLPAVFSASCAFMLPVATAPNAIVYGTRRITIAQMARKGFMVNISGAVIITLFVWLAL